MAKRMTRMAAAAVAATCLTPLMLAGCATKDGSSQREREQADANASITKPSTGVARYRIRDWSAPNDHTIIIVTNDGTRFLAETLGPCPGLDFTTRVGFVNRSSFNQIDSTSSVVLADGTRCPFQSFGEIRTAESKALDSYEKGDSGAKPRDDAKSKEDPAAKKSADEKPK